ncbi:PP2C family protein-serine/threonine phosphatase [Nocardioides jiangsuensis]|nr:PP2C family protein-serine/threonine phosphatase [Nocardioides jiangsuensis]
MVAAPHTGRPARLPARQLSRRWSRAWRRLRYSELSWVITLGVLSAVAAYAVAVTDVIVPVTLLVVPMVLANQLLGPRTLPWFVVATLGMLVLAVAEDEIDERRVGGIVICFVVGLIILISSFRRSQLGVAGSRGESMLVDLRERISKQSNIPDLPGGWYSEAVMRSAGGSSFAGDFIVASKSHDDEKLEVAVVDVSGKGEQAGTRSLLLSGSFGGLLGALPPEQFLPAANDYLLRQDWSEGFATAVHLSLDLRTGAFELRSAGHPPAVQLFAGSGRWGVHETEGPVLGLMRDADFTTVTGVLRRGDALLMFTDGLVETPQRDISLGIDKLLGQGERLLRLGFEQGANRLIDELESMNDDRALFLLHRR